MAQVEVLAFLGSISQQIICSWWCPQIQELGTLGVTLLANPIKAQSLNRTFGWLEAPGLFLAEVDRPKLDRVHGLTLEIGDSPGDGNPQQVHHLHASIPQLINTEASRAAFRHRKKQLIMSVPLLPESSFPESPCISRCGDLVCSLKFLQFEKENS